ncbi:MAG TPA: VOC family protein [Thermoplasmata archaeon]|nr:VOC family protein [Thermoplasmata archaeon]
MPTRASMPLTFYGPRLLVKDFRASWRFYRDVLGLRPLSGHGEPPYGEFALSAHTVLGIFDRKLMAKAVGLLPGRYSTRPIGRSALIWEVKDVDAVAARLRRKGVRLLSPPTDRPEWQLRTLHLRDPDGYLIEIESRLRPAST